MSIIEEIEYTLSNQVLSYEEKDTVLYKLCNHHNFLDLFRKNRIDLIKTILTKLSSSGYIFPRTISTYIQRFLFFSIKHGNTDIVKLLLEKDEAGNYIHPGVDVAAYNNKALRLSVEYGHTDIAKLLLEKDENGNYIHPGIDVAALNDVSFQAAVERGHTEIVRLLLAKDEKGNYIHHGIDVADCDNYALQFAAEYGYTEIVKLLLAKDEKGNYIHQGIDVSASNNHSLQAAAFNGHTEIVKLLLAKDEKGNYIHQGINVADCDNYALQSAASQGHVDIAKLLLEKDEAGNYIHPGINVVASNNYALLVAAKNCHIDIIKLLLSKDASGSYIYTGITNDIVANVVHEVYTTTLRSSTSSLSKDSHSNIVLSLRIMISITWGDQKMFETIPIKKRRSILSSIMESQDVTLKLMRISEDISSKIPLNPTVNVLSFLYGEQLAKGVVGHYENPYTVVRAKRIGSDVVRMKGIVHPQHYIDSKVTTAGAPDDISIRSPKRKRQRIS